MIKTNVWYFDNSHCQKNYLTFSFLYIFFYYLQQHQLRCFQMCVCPMIADCFVESFYYSLRSNRYKSMIVKDLFFKRLGLFGLKPLLNSQEGSCLKSLLDGWTALLVVLKGYIVQQKKVNLQFLTQNYFLL